MKDIDQLERDINNLLDKEIAKENNNIFIYTLRLTSIVSIFLTILYLFL